MNKRRSNILLRLLIWCLLLLPFNMKADIVYPARLELQEVEPGVFQVYFVLPVIQGKVLKAAPVFPDFCNYLEDPQVTGNAYVKEMRWTITCDPRELYGQNIGIRGLLGSQVNIILEVTTLEGRTYTTTLNPASAWFEIPYPPSQSELLIDGMLKGMRIPAGNFIFALLLLILLSVKNTPPVKLIALTSFGIITGHLLAYFEWLRIPGWIFGIMALLVSLLLVLETYTSKKKIFHKKQLSLPLVISMIFLGAQHASLNTLSGFTTSETLLLMIWTLTGIVLGVVLITLLTKQGLLVIQLLTTKTLTDLKGTGILLGATTLGLFLYYSSLLWSTPSLFPTIPLVLWTVTLILVTAYLLLQKTQNAYRALYLFIPCCIGMTLGFNGFTPPYAIEFTLALGLLLLVVLFFHDNNKESLSKIIFTALGFGSGLFLAQYCDKNLSYPIARSLEFALMVAFIASLLIPIGYWRLNRQKSHPSRLTGPQMLMALAVILIGIIIIPRAGFSLEEIPLYPQLQAPLLSLVTLIAAILLWPRQRKVHKDMGLGSRKPGISLLLLGVSLCCLPVKTGIKNPWFSSVNMDQKQIRAVMQQVLSNTYTAFNMEDEEELYEVLAANVDEQLLDNIYLDSRRRLTMGLREGSEVTVEAVKVDLLDNAKSASGEEGLSYPASWTVTARVKHLKHIHYRRNRYTGTIEMKTDNNTWKISKIILDSEDREVIPSATL